MSDEQYKEVVDALVGFVVRTANDEDGCIGQEAALLRLARLEAMFAVARLLLRRGGISA
jgi:hypothetical protein